MSNGLSWKDFESHFDNLIPGVVITAELAAIFPKSANVFSSLSGFEKGAVFVGISYALGLIAALLSRIVLDTASERFLRAAVFERWVHGGRRTLRAYYENFDQQRFANDLANERNERRVKTAEWNAIYRAALRAAKSPELGRRRAQGRMTRNLLFPVTLAVWLSCNHLKPDWSNFARFLCVCGGAVAVAFLYSYAELNNMAEAHDILDQKKPAAETSAVTPPPASAA